MLSGSGGSRKRMKVSFVATAIAMQFLWTGFASADDGKITIFGVGSKLCSEWTKAKASNPAERGQQIQWVEGYLSGASFYVKPSEFLAKTSPEVVIMEMDRTCDLQPNLDIAHAASSVGNEIIKRR